MFIQVFSKRCCRRAHRLSFFSASRRHLWDNVRAADVTVELANNATMTMSGSQLARFADGSVVAAQGDTSVLAVVVGKLVASRGDFAPLMVDYRQKAAAAGRIPTNFLRREIGASEREILIGRMIDRSMRPFFPVIEQNAAAIETQITCNTLALDGIYSPDVLSINAASAALAISDVPWDGPIGAVRVGRLKSGELIVNPTRRQQHESTLNLVVAAAPGNRVVMLDADAKGVLIQDFLPAIKFGVKECQLVIAAIEQLRAACGREKRSPVDDAARRVKFRKADVADSTEANSPIDDDGFDLDAVVKSIAEPKLRNIFTNFEHDKTSRDKAVQATREACFAEIQETQPDFDWMIANGVFSRLSKNVFRRLILDSDRRCDGRRADELRPIACEVDVFKPLHGSALFQRGQTQVLATVAFDSLDSALKSDPVSVLTGGLKEKNFMLHYEFPSFATNEIAKSTRFDRRELGHGALAEKALRHIVPDDFPFIIRLTSEVLESNGSSSMASVCGGSLALMDAGVQVSSPAAGVAIGLVTRQRKESGDYDFDDYKILTDILGIEDYLGDMDFKLAGTRSSITALQADIKVPGVSLKIIMEAVGCAHTAKNKILDIMAESQPEARAGVKPNGPVSIDIDVPMHRRAQFLGFGGRHLKRLTVDTGCQVTSISDTKYKLFAPNQEALDEGKQMIDGFLSDDREPELEFGAIYAVEIVEVRDGGVMVSLHPKLAPVYMPNAQLDTRRVSHASALDMTVGQTLNIKYFGRDPASGRHRISRKALLTTVLTGKGVTPSGMASSERK